MNTGFDKRPPASIRCLVATFRWRVAPVLDPQPFGGVGDVVDAGLAGLLALRHPERAVVEVAEEELRHERAGQVARRKPVEERRGCHRAAVLRPAEVGELAEVRRRFGRGRVARVVVEVDVAQKRHPVQLGHLARLLRALERRGRRDRKRLGVRALEVEREAGLGVHEAPTATGRAVRGITKRDGLEIFGLAAADRGEERVVRGAIDLASLVMRQTFRLRRDPIRELLLVAVRLRSRVLLIECELCGAPADLARPLPSRLHHFSPRPRARFAVPSSIPRRQTWRVATLPLPRL